MDERLGLVPADDGWFVRRASDLGRFVDIFGEMRIRIEGPSTVRIRVVPQRQHRNLVDNAHGGFLLALVDHSLFIGAGALGIRSAMKGVTIDTAAQFLAPVEIGKPADLVLEVLRETGRMIFMRGLIEQDGVPALAYSGTVRKATSA